MVLGLLLSLMVIGLTQLKAADKTVITGKGRALVVMDKFGHLEFACDATDNVVCTIEIEPLQ